MESGAFKILESATQRTLHAHAFSRSSSQASFLLTDLLSRYLTLLTSTCARYAEHAGRTTMNVRDAVAALEELGVSLDELKDYSATEGKELHRYALYSARRVEDILEFKSQLGEGLCRDRDDSILLEYARCPAPFLEELDAEDLDGSEDEANDVEQEVSSWMGEKDDMYVDGTSPGRMNAVPRKRPPSRPATPELPLSPISNPSSPKRKRPRQLDWDPPEYIPDFFPPFPSMKEETPGSPVPDVSTPLPQFPMPIPTQLSDAAAEKTAMTLSHSLITAAASDFLVQVPYSQSSLSAISERHLPAPLPPPPMPQTQQNNLPTLQIEPSLLGAYHHILTHPPPRELPPLNPSRHKIAMALIKQGQANPRYNPADTLFGSVAPCPPRLATIGPSYPLPIGDQSNSDKNKDSKDGKDKDVKLPQSIPRPVSSIERIAPFITQQSSQIPDLALRVLPPAIHTRTSRLLHPPVLYRGPKALVYGPGVAAPWNTSLPGQEGIGAGGSPTKDSTSKDGSAKPLLPDAKLYATWDYDTKDFRVAIAPTGRTRTRLGSLNTQSAGGGTGMISLPVSSRTKVAK